MPHGLIVGYDERKFLGFLSQYGVENVYLIRELTWSQHFSDLIRSLRSSPVLQPTGKVGFKDLDIYKFRVNPMALRNAIAAYSRP